MKGKQAEDFGVLKEKALKFIPYALSTCHKSKSKVENLETAEKLIKDRLLNVDELYRNGYISDDIKLFFGFVDKDLPLLIKVANSAVKGKQVKEFNDAENNSSPQKDDVEILLIKSLETQNGKGLLACEKWITEFRLTIAKMQPESLAKKLMDPKERKYTHSNFICAVKDKFLLLAYETEEIYREILKINSTYHNEKRRLNKILIRLQNYLPHIRKKADKLLLDSDPQEFIQATFKKLHIGDEMLADTLPVCVASTFLIGKNSGLPIKISGSSGKGKSSGVDAFLDLIPSYMLIKGGLSDKYLYYSDDMQAGSICFVDDKELSEPMKELVKNSITNFQKPEHHRTVINGEPKDLTAPERTVWIFASVDGFDDEQINNRLLQAEIDSSRTQDSKVAAFQRESENADISSSFKDDVEVCKCIYDLLGLRTYDIRIPFAEAIIWNHEYNRRNQPKFFDIIRAVCLYKIYQCEQVNGYFLASIEDYETAFEIYKKTTVQNNINLTESEQKIISCFVEANLAKDFYKNPKPENAVRLTYEQVEALTGINKPYVKKLINGKDTDSLGLGGKIKGLGFEGSGDGRQKKLIYYTGAADFEKYTKFSSLSTEPKIIEAITKSINDLEQAKNEVDEIKKEAFRELADSIPSIPADTLAIPSQKVPGIRDEKSISIINNIIKKGIDTLKKEKAPESKNFACITENIENKEVENIEHIVCKNSSNTLISQNQGIAKKIESTDTEIPGTLPKVSAGIEGIASTTDSEIPGVSGREDILNLKYTTEKILEYLNKECHGNSVVKSLDLHINDFRKLNPEFKQFSRQHLEFAFNTVLKITPPLDKTPNKIAPEEPVQKSKGISILEKALQAGKKEAVL